MPHLFRLASHQNRYYAWFEALHTRVDLLLLAPLSEAEFETVEAAMHAELHAVEKMGNRFDPDSELSRAVEAAATEPVAISSELYTLLARCLQAHRDTGGLFDITVNSPDFRPGLINKVKLTGPTAPIGEGSGSASLYFCCQEDLNSPPLREGHGDGSAIILDLSGVLKGYALERLRVLLPRFGIHDALINLGNSSILSLGHNPSDIPTGYCLTTSGNATADRRHIRNPLTGEFVIGQRTVSVTTANAIDGEIQSIVAFLQTRLNMPKY